MLLTVISQSHFHFVLFSNLTSTSATGYVSTTCHPVFYCILYQVDLFLLFSGRIYTACSIACCQSIEQAHVSFGKSCTNEKGPRFTCLMDIHRCHQDEELRMAIPKRANERDMHNQSRQLMNTSGVAVNGEMLRLQIVTCRRWSECFFFSSQSKCSFTDADRTIVFHSTIQLPVLLQHINPHTPPIDDPIHPLKCGFPSKTWRPIINERPELLPQV